MLETTNVSTCPDENVVENIPLANLDDDVCVDLGQSGEVGTDEGVDLGQDGEVEDVAGRQGDDEFLRSGHIVMGNAEKKDES